MHAIAYSTNHSFPSAKVNISSAEGAEHEPMAALPYPITATKSRVSATPSMAFHRVYRRRADQKLIGRCPISEGER